MLTALACIKISEAGGRFFHVLGDHASHGEQNLYCEVLASHKFLKVHEYSVPLQLACTFPYNGVLEVASHTIKSQPNNFYPSNVMTSAQ